MSELRIFRPYQCEIGLFAKKTFELRWIKHWKCLKNLKKAASLDFEHNVKKSRRAATQKKLRKNRVFYAQKPTGRHYKPLVLLLLSPWGHSNSVPAASLMSTTSEENIHVWEELYCKWSVFKRLYKKSIRNPMWNPILD